MGSMVISISSGGDIDSCAHGAAAFLVVISLNLFEFWTRVMQFSGLLRSLGERGDFGRLNDPGFGQFGVDKLV